MARAPAEALGFWRMALAAAVLAPLAWRRRRAWRELAGRERALAAAAGALFFAHLWLYTDASRRARIADCMIAFSVHPVLTAAGAAALGERVRPRLAAAFALAAAGVWLLWPGGALGRGHVSALLSAAAFSGYVLCGRAARRRLDNPSFAFAAYAVAGALFLGASAARGAALGGYDGPTWAAVAALGLGVTLLGHSLFTHLYAELDVHALGLSKLLEPPLGALVAYFAFGETVTARTAAAGALVLGAFAVASGR